MIDKEELEKYIFDPLNPHKCKSYKLLLQIAKKDPSVYFSTDVLRYIFQKQIFTQKFDDNIWDKPNNYNFLSIEEKLNLFVKNYSREEFEEFIENIDFDFSKITKYQYLKNFVNLEGNIYEKYNFYPIDNIQTYIKNNITSGIFFIYDNFRDSYIGNYLLFSFTDIELFTIITTKSSIFITLEDNSEYYINTLNEKNNFQNGNNLKPLFLKKQEDLLLLLNVLQNDLNKELNKSNENQHKNITNISSIEVNNFYSLKDIKLENLSDKKEIYIVGENGDGKTLLLQALTIALKGVKEGKIFDFVKSQKEYSLKVIDSQENTFTSKEEESFKNLFCYGANRNNNCKINEDETGYLTLFSNEFDLYDPIEWLKYIDHKEKSNENDTISLDTAILLLKNLLNSDIEIDVSADSVVFREKGSIVAFEQLSAGYKGVINLICDLLKRLSTNQPYISDIKDYVAIVLIDELELHLHPKWIYDFAKKLRDLFPKIQFIMTTHSPTAILGASPDAVFYKVYKENGLVQISEQIKNEGFTSNSLITSPLFDLESVTSRRYDKDISSDDYVYEKIHTKIKEKISKEINMNEEEILALIDSELEKL